jgi:hypothetical protein
MTEQPEEIEPFGIATLEGAAFHWLDTKKLKVQGTKGGEYDAPCILVDVKGYVVPIWVRLPQGDYDKLRMLRVQRPDIKAFSCSLGVKPTIGYAQRIFAGTLDW